MPLIWLFIQTFKHIFSLLFSGDYNSVCFIMSYMSQPCTNSEAVKRCLNIPIQPMSSQVARPIPPQRPLQPKPPYALVDSTKPSRPYSGKL